MSPKARIGRPFSAATAHDLLRDILSRQRQESLPVTAVWAIRLAEWRLRHVPR